MNKFLLTLVCLLYLYSNLSAQSSWEQYVAVGRTYETEIYGSKLYSANTGGLLVIDLDSKEETLFNPGNSRILELGVDEIEIESNGNLWVVGHEEQRLFYFDGSDFTLQNDSLRGVGKMVLANDVLWFAVSRINNEYQNPMKIFSLDNGVLIDHSVDFPNGIVLSSVDQDNNLWFTQENIIFRYDGVDLSDTIALPDSLWQSEKSAHFIDSQNRHWLSTQEYVYNVNLGIFTLESNLHLYENNSWTSISVDIHVEKFYEFQAGEITIHTRNAVGRIIDHQLSLDTVYQLNASLSEDSKVLLVTPYGAIWVESGNLAQDYKLFEFNANSLTQYGKNDGFLAWRLYDITKDCDENLIISAPHLIQKYRNGHWETIRKPTKNDNCLLYKFIDEPNDCENWLRELRVNCLSLWQIQDDSLKEERLLPEKIGSLTFDPQGNIYGVADGALVKIQPDGSSRRYPLPITPAQGLGCEYTASGSIFVIGFDNSNADHKIYEFKNETFTELDIGQFGDIDIAAWIYEDSKSHLWFATRESLLEYDGFNWTQHDLNINNPSNYINGILENHLGDFWISTREEGLIYYDGANTTMYTPSNSGLLNIECQDLVITNNEQLWISHNVGLTKMNIDGVGSGVEGPNSNSIDFSLFPNPTFDYITISNPKQEKRIYEVIGLTGEVILSEITNTAEWRANLDPGVYWIRMKSVSGEALKRVIVF